MGWDGGVEKCFPFWNWVMSTRNTWEFILLFYLVLYMFKIFHLKKNKSRWPTNIRVISSLRSSYRSSKRLNSFRRFWYLSLSSLRSSSSCFVSSTNFFSIVSEEKRKKHIEDSSTEYNSTSMDPDFQFLHRGFTFSTTMICEEYLHSQCREREVLAR